MKWNARVHGPSLFFLGLFFVGRGGICGVFPEMGVLACLLCVLFSSAAGGADWPFAISCPSLGPFPSIGGGARRRLTTLCPPYPDLAYPDLSTHPSFPSVGCANGAPGLSPLRYSVSGPQKGGQQPSPLARCVQVDIPIAAVGDPSPSAAFGPQDVNLRGQLPTGVHNNLSLARSRAQSSLWRAPPPTCVRGVCIVSPFPHVSWAPPEVLGGGWRGVMGGDGLGGVVRSQGDGWELVLQ